MKKILLFIIALSFNVFIACQSNDQKNESEPYSTTDTNRIIPKNSPDPDSVISIGSPNGDLN